MKKAIEILEVLNGSYVPVQYKRLINETSSTRKNLGYYLTCMIELGLIEKVSNGHYEITVLGKEFYRDHVKNNRFCNNHDSSFQMVGESSKTKF